MNTTATENKGYLYTFSKSSFGLQPSVSLSSTEKNSLIKVFIADDHPYLIHGVEADVNKDPRVKIVGSSNTHLDAIEKCEVINPDIILLDLKMPGKDQIDIKDIVSKLTRNGKTKVIIFSNETGWARIHRCLEVGASAYIEKAICLGNLSDFIHQVHDEDELLIFTAEQLPQIQFSRRQKEILHLIMEGRENNQISSTLNIELKTVQSYVNEIKCKLSEAFSIHPIRPRTLILLASKLGFGLN